MCGGRSHSEVLREVLPGERRGVPDELGGRPGEDDPTAVVAGAGADVDDPVGVRHDGLVVLDHDGFYAPLLDWIDGLKAKGFVGDAALGRLLRATDVTAALEACRGTAVPR